MKKHQIKQMDKEQAEKKLLELKKELLRLNSQRASGTRIENPGIVRSIKKDIARILTIKRSTDGGRISKQ